MRQLEAYEIVAAHYGVVPTDLESCHACGAAAKFVAVELDTDLGCDAILGTVGGAKFESVTRWKGRER